LLTSQTWCWTENNNPGKLRDMSKAAKNSGAAPGAPEQQVSFEDALRKLEGIVESMENSELPLETLLARFEEGTRLAEICQVKLAEAELKIQQLEKTSAGQIVARPAGLAEEAERE
jgi:exodeoxyribonuclease VII small subunit